MSLVENRQQMTCNVFDFHQGKSGTLPADRCQFSLADAMRNSNSQYHCISQINLPNSAKVYNKTSYAKTQ